MRTNFITTVYGPDIPGIVKALAQTTRRQGGEWLTSKVIKLDGRFAAIMSVLLGWRLLHFLRKKRSWPILSMRRQLSK